MPKPTDTLLIELGCEELPAKLTPQLADKLAQQLEAQLRTQQLEFDTVQWVATPRRIGLLVTQLVRQQADQTTQRLGPNQTAAFDKAGNPTQAAKGFAKSCGVTVETLTLIEGRLAFQQHTIGKATTELLPAIINQALQHPAGIKAMHWGEHQFLRPVRWLVVLYGKQPLNMSAFGCQASAFSHGHRFHSNRRIRIKHPDSYIEQLRQQGHVMVDATERSELIRQQLQTNAAPNSKVVIDEALLEEVTYLVEWPVVLRCEFDQAYLKLPNELLISVLHHHQKNFHCVSKRNRHKLAPYFMTVANLVSKDPARVIAGNERVVRARLADAMFCFSNDSHKTLQQHSQNLANIVFQHKLGTLADKTERITKLAGTIAEQTNANTAHTKLAAQLCKADLCCDTVNEFPELSGIIGHSLAIQAKQPAAIAEALRDYARPRHAQDTVPTSPVAYTVSIADKIDTLIGLFGINQPPTGVKDPFALRRAALGVVRTIISNQLSLPLDALLKKAVAGYGKLLTATDTASATQQFILDRLGTWYADQGIASGVFQAVSSCQLSDLLDIDQRMRAVQAFAALPEAKSLIAANKRVSQLLKKADNVPTKVSVKYFEADAEKALSQQLNHTIKQIAPLLKKHDYTAALTQLAELQRPVDVFFEQVMVMTEDAQLRNNRLALLNKLQQAFNQIADASVL